jgi:hypothetical protein
MSFFSLLRALDIIIVSLYLHEYLLRYESIDDSRSNGNRVIGLSDSIGQRAEEIKRT